MLTLDFLYMTKLLYLASLQYCSFPEFCHFRMEKKEFAVDMETWFNFLYSWIHIKPFDVISNYNKTNLRGIYMFKVYNKNSRTRCKPA